MTRRLPQSVAYTVVFKVFLSSDHVSPATGKTVAITLSKAGAAFGNPAAGASNATEISGGWYKFALGTGDTGTLGDLVLVGTATACDSADIIMMVVDAATGGLTNLDAAISSRASSAALATVQADTDDIQARLPAALVSGRMDASIGAMAANTLTASALATDAVSEIADGVLDSVDAIESGVTLRQATRVNTAILGGKVSGAGTGTETFRNAVEDSKNRIVATVDVNGNRTAITYNLT